VLLFAREQSSWKVGRLDREAMRKHPRDPQEQGHTHRYAGERVSAGELFAMLDKAEANAVLARQPRAKPTSTLACSLDAAPTPCPPKGLAVPARC
jgi:hypothetical protein